MGESFMSYHSDPLIREYQDRGMAKWMGFYLSEHTAQMRTEKNKRNATRSIKPQMSAEEIAENLNMSYLNKALIEIQLAALNSEGEAFADIIGVVLGFDDTTIFLADANTKIQAIPNGSIRHVHLVKHPKWSDFS
ncbi:hypothetical protein [Enterococcus xiangfangensis]|uniref:DNA-directed RNA polymerase beta subunit n=1 Tax=Enterococcus xiangfangensis TaxID=1296537 RepID=A0ABU3F8M7_9ENTE|nr:hypothetical protein [Enterococcus xiangfangensis]MDT2759030.1 hypothetical protein [Enterococcus xiangfangensis]